MNLIDFVILDLQELSHFIMQIFEHMKMSGKIDMYNGIFLNLNLIPTSIIELLCIFFWTKELSISMIFYKTHFIREN